MAITKIKVSNFKSFKDLELELGNFNVIVGANASGKSNFTQIFRFIRDIVKEGLENAISMQGSEYLTFMGVPFPKILSLSFTYDIDICTRYQVKDSIGIEISQLITQDFALKFEKPGGEFKIIKDGLSFKINFLDWEKVGEQSDPQNGIIDSGEVKLCNNNGKIEIKINKPHPLKNISDEEIFPHFFKDRNIYPQKSLLLELRPWLFVPFGISFEDIGLYDFDPKISKKATTFAGKYELVESGENLSLVLKRIIENPYEQRKFSNLIKDLLPFVEDLSTDKFTDKSLLFKLKEKYFDDTYFPASFISDGTVNVSALLTALYFEKKSVTIIEEPERNIHPSLISRLVDMMKDASKKKQIIVTTHNPEIVKYAGLENLLLISRDKEGFSTISRPKDNERVKTFMKNELGLDELYVQNLLED